MTLDPDTTGAGGGRLATTGLITPATLPSSLSTSPRFHDGVPVLASTGEPPSRPARPRSTGGGNTEHTQFAGPRLTLDGEQFDRLAGLFKLLSDRTRLSILQLLCDGEMNVTALCRKLKLPQPTVSHHLGLLRMNRIIANRRNGKQVFYKLHDRVQPVMLPEADDGSAGLDGATRELGAHPTGLQILDGGVALQIITSRAGARSIFPRLEKSAVR